MRRAIASPSHQQEGRNHHGILRFTCQSEKTIMRRMHKIFTRGRPAALANTLHNRPWLGYPMAIAVVWIAFVLRMKLGAALPPGLPFITLVPAVMIVAFFAGPGPGLAASAVSALAAWYFFLEPAHKFALSPTIAVALAFYLTTVVTAVGMLHLLRTTALRLQAEREMSLSLAEQRAFLFRELQHRVANNMAFLVAILSMQKSSVRAAPRDAEAVLDDAIRRIRLFSTIHRRLHDPDSATRSLSDHFQALFNELVEATNSRSITCTLVVEQMPISGERLMTLSLIATELMTNALKHAFSGRETGVIDISLSAVPNGHLRFSITDDGIGAQGDADTTSGLGNLIVDALVEQLGGTKRTSTAQGTQISITFPAEG
jgi:two-component sensor histidine kinase